MICFDLNTHIVIFHIMERKITTSFEKWRTNSKGKALLVKGCRQIGKTYSIMEFARTRYDNVIYLNFENEPEHRSLFDGSCTADSFCEKLAYTSFASKMIPGKTVVIFDEIQACPGALSALKPLVEDGRFDYIGSGSLLGVTLSGDRLSPMGYLTIVEMHPMDFEEFLWANGVGGKQTSTIHDHVRDLIPFDDFILDRLHDLFLRYLVVGGMPEAVQRYVTTKDYSKVAETLSDLMIVFQNDSSRYSPIGDRMRIANCLRSIPEQLGKENNTFSYHDIEGMRGAGVSRYGSSIDWLIASGLAVKVKNVSEPREPLKRNVKERSFKIYLNDTGLLTHMLEHGIAGGIVNGDFMINNGAVMENAVAVMLLNKGHQLYFFQKSNSTLEIDFLLNLDSEVTAIKVKSGRYDYPKSLITVMSDRYGVQKGMLLANENIRIDDHGVIHLPLFAAAFLDPPEIPMILPVDGVDELNRLLGGSEDTSS